MYAELYERVYIIRSQESDQTWYSRGGRSGTALDLGSGRIVASEKEAPNTLANLV